MNSVTVRVGEQTLTLPYTITTDATPRFPGDPGIGKVLWGQTRDGGVGAMPARAAQYAQILGRPSPVYPRAFHSFGTPAQATVAGARGMVDDVRTVQGWGSYALQDVKEPTSMSFAQVGTGGMDQVLDELFSGLVALGKPCAVSFHNEPAGDGKGGAVEYASALKRFVQRRDAAGGKSLITLTGFLGMGSFTGFGGSNGDPVPWLQAIAPWVDAWGTNRYLQATDSSPASAWKTPEQVYGPFWDLEDAIDPNRAKIHGEWGVHTRASDLTYAPAWMVHWKDYFISRGGALAFFFDSGQNSANSWVLDLNGETSRLVAFAHLIEATANV